MCGFSLTANTTAFSGGCKYNVGGRLRERRIGADAPTAPPRRRDLMLTQNPPDLVFGNVAQMFGQQDAVPASGAQRRRLRSHRASARGSCSRMAKPRRQHGVGAARWHANGLKPHLLKTFKLSNDPDFIEKLEDVVGRSI